MVSFTGQQFFFVQQLFFVKPITNCPEIFHPSINTRGPTEQDMCPGGVQSGYSNPFPTEQISTYNTTSMNLYH
ncbi:hypothetical protein VN97_g10041 [Penicillium thymicola]|uniref:Uncharacterized protein n=1 Tax=Penicillium thymicola TaxID=293382 RepID=A0AAI9TAL2_PENTH|nr:hypothetical protein VN97_g10041 [Penicillium thymicola]